MKNVSLNRRNSQFCNSYAILVGLVGIRSWFGVTLNGVFNILVQETTLGVAVYTLNNIPIFIIDQG